jgi:hypothetical protein
MDPGYSAPELINLNEFYQSFDEKIDVFSTGCILWEL